MKKDINHVLVTGYSSFYINKLNKVLEYIKESFIEFYDESNRRKIDDLFSKLIVVVYSQNNGVQQLEKNIQEGKKILEDKIDKRIAFDTAFNILKVKNLKNNSDSHIYLFSNKILNKVYNNEEKNELLESVANSGSLIGGYTFPKSKVPIVCIEFNGKINIGTLIHEISHTLQHSDFVEIISDNGTLIEKMSVDGISDNVADNMLNEVINAYITNDVLEIFNQRYSNSDSYIEYGYSTGYLQIDKLLCNYGLKIYELLKKEIKKNFVNGSATIVGNIIGSDNYILYSEMFITLKEDILQSNIKSLKKYKDYRYDLLSYYFSLGTNILNNIQKRYKEYLDYNESLNNIVNTLVEEGEVRKLR